MVKMYKFQCPVCFIVSGYMSRDPNDAPECCGGVKMTAILIECDTSDNEDADI